MNHWKRKIVGIGLTVFLLFVMINGVVAELTGVVIGSQNTSNRVFGSYERSWNARNVYRFTTSNLYAREWWSSRRRDAIE